MGQEDLLKEISEYSKTRYGIITSSLEGLININPTFKKLLLFICLLDSQNIPKELLGLCKENTVVDNFIHNLKKYSLITNESPTTLSLHRSTQTLGQVFLLNSFSKTDKEMFISEIMNATSHFYHKYLAKNQIEVILLIPHLEELTKNLEHIHIPTSSKEKHKIDLFLLLGYAYKQCSRNFKLAKKYLTYVYTMQSKNYILPDIILATLLKDIGEINSLSIYLDESIFYCQQSIKICKRI